MSNEETANFVKRRHIKKIGDKTDKNEKVRQEARVSMDKFINDVKALNQKIISMQNEISKQQK